MRLSCFHIALCFYSQDDRPHESVTGREGGRAGEGGSDVPNRKRKEGDRRGGRREVRQSWLRRRERLEGKGRIKEHSL